MKKFILLLISLYAINAGAQELVVIKNSQDLKKVNDSLQKILNIIENDSLAPPKVTIVLGESNPSEFNTTIVDINGESMTIITDKKGRNTSIRRKRKDRSYFISYSMDLGYNRLDNSNLFTGTKNTGNKMPTLENNNSVSFALYPALVNFKLIGKDLVLTTGLGLEWFNFRFSGNTTMTKVDGVATAVPVSEVFGVENVFKSKLTASYVNLPLMLRASIPGASRGFNISTGMLFGVNLSSHTKVVHRENGGRTRLKNFDDLGLKTLRYGLTFRVSYNFIGFYMNYYMTPLFSANEGPQVYPYTIGMTFSFY